MVQRRKSEESVEDGTIKGSQSLPNLAQWTMCLPYSTTTTYWQEGDFRCCRDFLNTEEHIVGFAEIGRLESVFTKDSFKLPDLDVERELVFSASSDRNDIEDYRHREAPARRETAEAIPLALEANTRSSMMMDECQKEQEEMRPLFLGLGLVGVALCCFVFVTPTYLMSQQPNLLLSAMYTTAAFTSAFVGFKGKTRHLSLGLCIAGLLVFVAVHFKTPSQAVPYSYLAMGPIVAVLHVGYLSLSSDNVTKWMNAAKTWPPIVLAMVLLLTLKATEEYVPSLVIGERTANLSTFSTVKRELTHCGWNTLLGVLVIALVMAILAQVVLVTILANKPKLSIRNGGDVTSTSCTGNKADSMGPLKLYLKDKYLHLLLPLAFFCGLHEAFMIRHFLQGPTFHVLGIQGVCFVLATIGIARMVSTWVSSHASLICPFHVTLGLATTFQLGLLTLLQLWKPSADDPLMFYAIAFVWGCVGAAWDFLILGNASRLYSSDSQRWSASVAVISLHNFAGMAAMFGVEDVILDSQKRLLVLIVVIFPSVLALGLLHKESMSRRDKGHGNNRS